MQTLQFIGMDPRTFKEDLVSAIKEVLISIEEQKQKPEEALELLNSKEVAKILRVSESTVRRWTKEGRLPSYGVGNGVLYKRHEIEESLIDLTPKNHD